MDQTRASFFSPVFRSRRHGHRQLRLAHILTIGLVTWLFPAFLGGVMLVPIGLLDPQVLQGPLAYIAAIFGLMIFAPLYGIVLVPLALALGLLAMRFGMTGWAFALGSSGFVAAGLIGFHMANDPGMVTLSSQLIYIPIVMLHGAVLWMVTRLICPDALMPPGPQGA